VLKKDPTINSFKRANFNPVSESVSFGELGFEIAFGVIDYDTSESLDDSTQVYWNVYLEERFDLEIIERTTLEV
jgi:hypothetical protein